MLTPLNMQSRQSNVHEFTDLSLQYGEYFVFKFYAQRLFVQVTNWFLCFGIVYIQSINCWHRLQQTVYHNKKNIPKNQYECSILPEALKQYHSGFNFVIKNNLVNQPITAQLSNRCFSFSFWLYLCQLCQFIYLCQFYLAAIISRSTDCTGPLPKCSRILITC